jgi:hypothetical protein
MPTTIKVVPAQGLRVKDPISGLPIPESGMFVQSSPYWLRRLSSGDVTFEQVAQGQIQAEIKSEVRQRRSRRSETINNEEPKDDKQ